MLLSYLMITNTYDNLNKISVEKYTEKENPKKSSKILFYGAIIFFIMELILFSYAIVITKLCSRNIHETIIHSILAITFTTPYVFFSMLSNPCAKDLFIKKN
jgi:hypothetical protein